MCQAGVSHTSLEGLQLWGSAGKAVAPQHRLWDLEPRLSPAQKYKALQKCSQPLLPVAPSPAPPFRPLAESCGHWGLPGLPQDQALITTQHSMRDFLSC